MTPPDAMRAWLARQPTDHDGHQRVAPLGLHSVEPALLANGRWSIADRFGTLPPTQFPGLRPGDKMRVRIIRVEDAT